MNQVDPAPGVRHHHAVKFYRHEESLFTTVAAFLAEGLVAGQPAIVIATPEHRDAITAHLCGRLIDCAKATRDGDLVFLDAEDTLDLFMVDGLPDPALFERNIGAFVEQVLHDRKRTVVRAYGEMVDVLWKQGLPEAAIALEILWNKLALKYRFALLCGYAMGSFYKQSQQFEDVCRQHSHVVDDNVVPFVKRA